MRETKMNTKEQLLPVGSVVYLKEGKLKIVILGRGQIVQKNKEDRKLTYYDYLASLYPQGYEPQYLFHFNHDKIDKIVFEGYQNEEEKHYLEVLNDWKEKHQEEYLFENE